MRRATQYVAAALALCSMYGCGGGHGAGPLPPDQTTINPSLPAQQPTPPPGSAATTPTPPPPSSFSATTRIPSTTGRVAAIQIFDYAGYGAPSWISADARKYDVVWGTVYPHAWDNAHSGMLVADYYILGLDRKQLTGRNISWFRANHPDWVMYSCKANGSPTRDPAYMEGVDDEVPLDIHNPAVVQDQIKQIATDAKARGYNTIAVDQALFWNVYGHGSKFGCGVYSGGTFVRRYSSPNDTRFDTDIVNYVRAARTIAHNYGLTLAINHPAGDINNPLEQEIVQSADIALDEDGFSRYGKYHNAAGSFTRTLAYTQFAQRHGTAIASINKFNGRIRPEEMDYVMAGYFLANDGGLLMMTGTQYNAQQYHGEYDTPIGRPCSGTSGGPLFTRRFSGGFVVLNDSRSTQTVSLPSSGLRDMEGRAVSNPLRVGPMDGYVLVGAGGC